MEKGTHRYYTEENTPMAKKKSHENKFLTLLVIKKLHINIKMRYHYNLIRMANLKNWWQICVKTVLFIHCWWEYKMA